jgi:hypothetical protein
MKLRILIKLLFAILLFSPPVFSDSVFVQNGHVFLKNSVGKALLLTRSGHDSQAVLSADEKWVAFVREIPGRFDTLNPVDDKSLANELWLISSNGQNLEKLVSYGQSSGKSGAIFAVNHPAFFPDNRRIAFNAGWTVTEGSVHIVDRVTKKVQFVSAGNSVEVVPEGEYKNHLMVQRHKYFLGGGSYDWYWLLDTNGKEIGAIGEEENLNMFKETYLP